MKILWSLVFTATAFCTEVDNSVWLKIDRDCKSYEVEHAGKQYTLPSENINKDERHISFIFGSEIKNERNVVNINHDFTVNNSIAITCALQALALVEPLQILDYFFGTDNEHFYDIYNVYNLLVPSNAFKSYFYSVMILKESLHNSDEFNLKAYMFTLDESTLCTPTYKKKIKERLEKTSEVKEEERTAEICEESLLVVKCEQKKELLCALVNTYIGSTVLAKIKQGVASLSENQRVDLQNLIETDASQKRWSDAEIRKLHESKKYITEDGDPITLDKFTELVKRMLLIYSLERTLNQDKINESMVLNDVAFAFIIEKLSFLQDDILDCSYVPITTLTKNKLWLSDFFGIFNIDFKSMTKVKIFCDLKEQERLDIGLNIMNTLFEVITVDNDSDSQSVKQNEHGYIDNKKEDDLEQNFNNIISSLYTIRQKLPGLKEIYFTDDDMGYIFSGERFDKFNKMIFYPNSINRRQEQYTFRNPVNIYIKQGVYNNTAQQRQIYDNSLNRLHNVSLFLNITSNLYYASYITGFVLILWHLLWCEKDIHFLVKIGLFVYHCHLNRYNKWGSILYKIKEFSPIVLLLCVYGQWSVLPNIFRMPYVIPFFAGTIPLSFILYTVNSVFDGMGAWRDPEKILDNRERIAIKKHGRYIFHYNE